MVDAGQTITQQTVTFQNLERIMNIEISTTSAGYIRKIIFHTSEDNTYTLGKESMETDFSATLTGPITEFRVRRAQ